MALEKSDLQSWTSALIRKIMWLGAFYALLLFGRQWIPAIIDSFSQLGGAAAGINGNQGLSPSNVFTQGLNIAAALMDAASTSAFFTNPATSIAVMISAAFVVLAFIAVAIQYIVAIVESYLVVSAGVIFLGFGGSRWTTPYVERYIGLGVSTGVKIMILYMLIGVGMNLSGGWLNEAVGIGTSTNPSMTGFDVMGAALIFMMLCWQVPKLFAAVLGGSPALSGGDLVSTGAAVVGGTAMVASMGAGAIAAAAGATAVASGAAAGGSSAGGVASRSVAGLGGTGAAGTGSIPPPSSLPGGSSPNGRPKQPSPPATGGGATVPATSPAPLSSESAGSVLSSLGGENLTGSGFEAERPAAGFRSYSLPLAPRQTSSNSGTAPSDHAAVSNGPPGESSVDPTGSVSDVASSRSSSSERLQPPATGRGERLASGARRTEIVFSGAAERLRNTGQRFRGLPTDAAPHMQPPRMPKDSAGNKTSDVKPIEAPAGLDLHPTPQASVRVSKRAGIGVCVIGFALLVAFAYGGYRRQVRAQAAARDSSLPKAVVPATASANEVEKEIPSGNAPLVRSNPNQLQPPNENGSPMKSATTASCGFDPHTGQPYRFNPDTGQPCTGYSQDRVVVRQPAYAPAQVQPTPGESTPEEQRIAAVYQREQEAMIAPTSIKSGTGQSSLNSFSAGVPPQGSDDLTRIAELRPAISGRNGNAPASEPAQFPTGGTRSDRDYEGQNLQTAKAAFLSAAEQQKTDDYLRSTRTAPLSPYEIKVGWEIPAVLEQNLNSDLPGEIKALISSNVFDTASGRYLLIPQGSRLIGKYDSRISYGQDGVQVVWDRIIFPDASSVDINGMVTAVISVAANGRLRSAVKRRGCTVTELANSALHKWLGGKNV
jgi:P-type conjugative transfer protein TrbL